MIESGSSRSARVQRDGTLARCQRGTRRRRCSPRSSRSRSPPLPAAAATQSRSTASASGRRRSSWPVTEVSCIHLRAAGLGIAPRVDPVHSELAAPGRRLAASHPDFVHVVGNRARALDGAVRRNSGRPLNGTRKNVDRDHLRRARSRRTDARSPAPAPGTRTAARAAPPVAHGVRQRPPAADEISQCLPTDARPTKPASVRSNL